MMLLIRLIVCIVDNHRLLRVHERSLPWIDYALLLLCSASKGPVPVFTI